MYVWLFHSSKMPEKRGRNCWAAADFRFVLQLLEHIDSHRIIIICHSLLLPVMEEDITSRCSQSYTQINLESRTVQPNPFLVLRYSSSSLREVARYIIDWWGRTSSRVSEEAGVASSRGERVPLMLGWPHFMWDASQEKILGTSGGPQIIAAGI